MFEGFTAILCCVAYLHAKGELKEVDESPDYSSSDQVFLMTLPVISPASSGSIS
jgi:hypothetical protein